MLKMFSARKLTAGILCAIATGLFVIQVLYGLWQIKSVSVYFRNNKFSFKDVKREVAVGLTTSDLGRTIARETVLH
jgi:hypothetical protein